MFIVYVIFSNTINRWLSLCLSGLGTLGQGLGVGGGLAAGGLGGLGLGGGGGLGTKPGLGVGLTQTGLGGGGGLGLSSSISQPSLGSMPASMPVTKPVLPQQQHPQLQQQQQPASQFVLGKPPAGRKRNA